MVEHQIPPQPKNSIRITLQITSHKPRLDSVLLEALRKSENLALRNISRTEFKKLFEQKKILIKGQNAKPSSSIAVGTTYIDILGFGTQA